MNEAEIRIAQNILPRDWTRLLKVIPQVTDFFGRDLDLEMINRYLHEGLLELALVAPNGTMTVLSRSDCEHRTIHAAFNRAEAVWVEPLEAGHYLARLAESISPATATPPPKPQLPNSPIAEIPKLSGKEWVPEAYARRPGALLAMGITGASEALAEESSNAADCGKRLNARYIEKLLRELGAFPKVRRK